VSSTLVVSDERDRELWRKDFGSGPRYEFVLARYHGDLDGDGRVETIVPLITGEHDSKGAFLYCYSEKGQELWRIEPKRAVSDRRMQYSTIYVLRTYQVFSSPEKDGTHWVVATFAHHYQYPSVTVVVDGRGKTRGEYWHSGHLDEVHIVDLDGDTNQEILLAGMSRGSSRAVIEVLDPRNVAGAQVLPPDHPNQLLGFEPGTAKATIVFERSRLNKLKNNFNYAYWIGPSSAADRSFQVYVSEGLDRAKGYLIYTIRPDLSLASVIPSQSLLSTYLEYSLANPASKPFGQSDLEELRRGYTVERGVKR
jgi:hypothetical protein